jgi:hypothetical protein
MKGSEQIFCIQRSRCLFVFAGEKVSAKKPLRGFWWDEQAV